jgi:hypothetical protein
VAGDPSESETVVPDACRRSPSIDVDVTRFPEPIIPDTPLMLDSMRPSGFEPSSRSRAAHSRWEDLMHRARETKLRMIEGTRRFPHLWTGITAVGLIAIAVALGIALWKGSRADAPQTVPLGTGRGFSATTQEVLMGERQVTAAVEPAPSAEPQSPAASEPAKKPLPPLVIVEDARAIRIDQEK